MRVMSTLHPEDHILVRTIQGDIKSLMIHDIQQVIPIRAGCCRIRYHTTITGLGDTARVMEVQEDAQVFLERCQSLRQAIEQQDERAINRHFALG